MDKQDAAREELRRENLRHSETVMKVAYVVFGCGVVLEFVSPTLTAILIPASIVIAILGYRPDSCRVEE